jgi:ATP-dependent helicase HrpB
MRRLAENWARIAGGAQQDDREAAGPLLALAYPDRVARARGREGEFVMASGRAGRLDPASPLARETYLVIADLAGAAGNARILAAATIGAEAIERLFADRIEARTEVTFDPQAAALRARAVRRLGAVNLGERPLPVPADTESAAILARGIVGLGLDRLPWTPGLSQWRARVQFLRAAEGGDWPDLSDAALAESAETWLAPALVGRNALAAITPDDLAGALQDLLPWQLRGRLDAAAPTHVEVPTGSRIPVDYTEAEPVLAVRVQELFGLDRHPTAGGRPLVLHLLSPAHRPIQITRDLPGFWRGSWAAVRAEMRGRYLRHPWPEDPLTEAPTRRAKPRGT